MDNTELDNTLSDDLVLSSSNSGSDTEPTGSIIPNSSNAFVDKITLELLLNKTNYQKYLSKSEPQKFAEYQEFLNNCNKYKRQMVNITCSLIDNPANKCSPDVANAFETYAKILIRDLELKEMTDSIQAANNQEYNVRDLDEDVLFPAMMDNDNGSNGSNDLIDTLSDNSADEFDQTSADNMQMSMSFFVPPQNNRTAPITQAYTMDRFVIRRPSNKNSK